MIIDIQKTFGKWRLKKWNSRLLDSEYQDVYQDSRNNVISEMYVWETEQWYSNIYSGLFKRDFDENDSPSQYVLYFKTDIDHRGQNEVELLNYETNRLLGKFWWKYLDNEDWPQNVNLEISLLDYKTYGNIDIVDQDKLVLTDITDGVRVNGKIIFEYGKHQLEFKRIIESKSQGEKKSSFAEKENRSWLRKIFR